MMRPSATAPVSFTMCFSSLLLEIPGSCASATRAR